MTDFNLGPTISDEAGIKGQLRLRKSEVVLKTVTGSTSSILKQKVGLEEADGWAIFKRNKKSVRMAKDKPPDQLLEDEMWTIFAQMGFKELSLGRQFQISMGKNLPPRQIDIFAKDDETILIVECTHRSTPGRKSMDSLIQKLSAIDQPIRSAITRQYGREANLKVKYIIATRNVSWSKTDLEKCKESSISVISDNEIAYYSGLVRHLKHAARYQLLAHVFEGSRIKGLDRKVVATQGTMGGDRFYAFLIPPDELLKIAYVGHKSSRDIEHLRTYQRMLQPKRLKQIAEYINAGGKFPTNIVVNLKTRRSRPLEFERLQKVGTEALGILHLPPRYGSAWIIDGQHRLYGYAYARAGQGFKQDTSTIPVLAYENLPADKEMNLFIDINSKQVKVSTSLLVELYSDLHWDSTDQREAFQALLSRLASRLNSERTSPLSDRVVVTGRKKTSFRCLTQTSLKDGLQVARLLGSYSPKQDTVLPGPFSTANPTNYKDNLEKAYSVLTDCLRYFAEKLPDHWVLGDAPGGYLCTNNGLRALFHVLADITEHVRAKEAIDLCLLDADEVFGIVHPYLVPLGEYLASASSQEIQAFRRIGSSLTAVRQQSFGLEAHLSNRFPEFSPSGLSEYLESRDQAGTEEAAGRVIEIHRKLSHYVMGALKRHYGEENKKWWTEGVPLKIRQQCTAEWEAKKREGNEEEHLYLISYMDICHQNWDLVRDVISLDGADKSNKKKSTEWIRHLNEIRKITTHPERGILTSDQVNLVEVIHTKVLSHFPGST